MKHYLGGYYLMQIEPIEFGSEKGQCVLTCSTCINNSLLDSWSFSWATTARGELNTAKKRFSVDDKTIHSIHEWTDINFDDKVKSIGWSNVFSDIHTALSYHKNYFSHLENIKLFALYFSEQQAEALIDQFKPTRENQGLIGLVDMLQRHIYEIENTDEELIGYDFIGIELGGSFHTFHCHDISEELISSYELKLNKYGLFDESKFLVNTIDYMNDENSGLEPVPWFLAKVKLAHSL